MEFNKINDYPRDMFKRAYLRKDYLKICDEIKTIAIYKSGGGLGDLVQGIPLFRGLKEMFPQAKIVYLGLYQRPRCDTLFENIPYIDEYVEYVCPVKQKSFRQNLPFLKKYFGIVAKCFPRVILRLDRRIQKFFIDESCQFMDYVLRLDRRIKSGNDKSSISQQSHFRKFDLIFDTQSKFIPSFFLWLLNPKFLISRNMVFSHWRVLLNPKLKVHVVSKMLALLRALGFEQINFSPVINISDAYLSLAESYLKRFQGPFISILPGAGHPFKIWDKKKFAQLADIFYAKGYQVILIGDQGEKELLLEISGSMKNKPIVPLLDDPRFGQNPVYSVGLFKASKLTVGCDCGGLHLASLSGCPVIGIYGPTNPVKSGPLGERNIVIFKNLNCSPCRMGDCKINRKCFSEINPEDIIQASDIIINSAFIDAH